MTVIGRAMALDVGDNRVGVALSDPLRIIAQPRETIARKGKAIFRRLMQLIKEEGVSTVVVGIPYELSGVLGPQAQKVIKFEAELITVVSALNLQPPVEFARWDERFSTVAADRAMIGSKLRNSDRRAERDSVAAALILEGYLSSIRGM